MTLVVTIRRKPVPRAWREQHHHLHMWSHRSYAAMRGGGSSTRSGGTCSCGATFGLAAGDHTSDFARVLDEWRDHVAQAYHGDDYYTRTEVRS